MAGANQRGAVSNPPNRFDRFHYEADPEAPSDEVPSPSTVFFKDPARQIITSNDSPDVGFDRSINPYRGCEHGCVYCFARPTHEYLGFSAGLDFESKILVKEDAPELLRSELSSPRWTPQVIAVSGVTDAWQPIERKLGLTRRCLDVLAEFRNPIVAITKSNLITRDADLFARLAEASAAAVLISVTTLDERTAGLMEPRAARPQLRLDAIRQLAEAGVPVGVMVAPIVPAITDHEVPAILAAAAEAGASFAGYTILRLPWSVAPVFEAWVSTYFPDRAEKIFARIREIRNGKLNDARWFSRTKGEGEFGKQISRLFEVGRRKAGLDGPFPDLSTAQFRRPAGPQLPLF
jgi:DNA repair photolyase